MERPINQKVARERVFRSKLMWPLAAAKLRFSLEHIQVVLRIYLFNRCTSLCIPTRGDYSQFGLARTGRVNFRDIGLQ